MASLSYERETTESPDICPECGATVIVFDETRGERSCGSCGLVIEQIFTTGPEWRAYNSAEEAIRARSSSPSFLNEDLVGFQTEISRGSRDAQGRILPTEKRSQFSRLANLDRRANYAKMRNLRIAFRELKRLKSQLNLSDSVVKTASLIYRQSLKASLVRGRSIDGIVSASLYIACRKENVPITLKDIEDKANHVSPKELGRCVRLLIKELKLKKLSPTDPISYLHRLADSLNLTMATRMLACDIVKKAKDLGITVGKNPMSIAAAALYLASVQTGERRTQAQLANAAKTTPVTIRNRFKELIEVLDLKLEIKRGAAAVPVYIKDKYNFTKNLQSS